MADSPRILLTNDDGIDTTGFRACYDALQPVGDVTAVAPIDDQSAVGRTLSFDVGVMEHELGYAIEGTPADCVVAGLGSLVPDADLVVSGCNEGANLGAYNLGRSGTVSAAVEAAFFGVPAIAVSLYIPVPADVTFADIDWEGDHFEEVERVTRYLAEATIEADVFEEAEYLNVNVPAPEQSVGKMSITRPSHVHMLDSQYDGGDRITLHDPVWERMAEGNISEPEDTDRRAIVDGEVSVSPLTAPHTTRHHDRLDELAAAYPEE